MSGKYLGIDIGTTSIKAAVFTSEGEIVLHAEDRTLHTSSDAMRTREDFCLRVV